MWFQSDKKATRPKKTSKKDTSRPAVPPISQPPPYAQLAYRPTSPYAHVSGVASTRQANNRLQGAISSSDLPTNTVCPIYNPSATYYNHSLHHIDAYTTGLCDVLSQIDEDEFHGTSDDLSIMLSPETFSAPSQPLTTDRRLITFNTPTAQPAKRPPTRRPPPNDPFHKLTFYLNSTLPPTLPPLRLYIPTYPLLCLAATSSANAYLRPPATTSHSSSTITYISPSPRHHQKAMLIKTTQLDSQNLIVVAIRGTNPLSWRDWSTNIASTPAAPTNFLDDEGNLVHAGFLRVARATVPIIAGRLREMLLAEQVEGTKRREKKRKVSVLLTGHSAGGAVAALVYAHMLSTTVKSELTELVGRVGRVHCVTFGSPPVSLLALGKGEVGGMGIGEEERKRRKKWLFFGVVNEGDPVVRAEVGYMRSLVELLGQPVPSVGEKEGLGGGGGGGGGGGLGKLGASMSRLDLSLKPNKEKKGKAEVGAAKLWWDVPLATFCNAGKLVVLRVKPGEGDESVGAFVTGDEEIRKVVFGDPMMHRMGVYKRRIEALACKAVTGRMER